jgi:hypothetical protein
MNKILKIGLILTLLLMLPSCIIYGKGETIGYIYAVDDGIFWDKVWYKTNLESSESDCYLLNTDNVNLKEELRQLSGKVKLKLHYQRHFMTWAMCPDGTSTEDEIMYFEVITD